MLKKFVIRSYLPLASLFLFATNSFAIPSGFNITEIANSSGPLAYKYYDWAAMNENGLVCYHGTDSINSAILKGDGIQRQSIAATDDGSGLYSRFTSKICSINDNGDVAFDACANCSVPINPNLPSTYRIWKYSKDFGINLKLAESGGLADSFAQVSLPTINSTGDVSFSGELNNQRKGIWIRKSDTITPINIFNSDGIFSKLGGAFLNDSLQIVFGGEEDSPTQNAGIYGPNGGLVMGTFSGYSEVSLPAINNSGTIVNLAKKAGTTSGFGNSEEQGVYVNGSPFVLNTGDFEQVDLSSFQGVSINNKGDIVFPAFRPNGNSVIFFAVQGGIIPLIEKGDIVPGHTSPVEFATVSRESINNSRQIAITARLQDSSELVLRFDPVSVVFPDDQCPADNSKFLPGVCGCGVSDIDSNTDGVLDCQVTPSVRKLTTDTIAALKLLKVLPSNASKSKKKAMSANVKNLKSLLNKLLALVRVSSQQVKLTSNKKSALQLVNALKAPVSQAAKLSSRTFAKDKKAASTALSKFLKLIAAS